MTIVGTVESLWRYPVKSMAGETVPEAFFGFGGLYGDRMYGFLDSAAPAGAPFLTARDRPELLLYRPRFRNKLMAAKPPNQAEAERLEPGMTPLYPGAADLIVDVETPDGEVLSVDDVELLRRLAMGGPRARLALVRSDRPFTPRRTPARGNLSVVRSDRALTDSRPISLIALQTIKQLGDEVMMRLDKRRFRSNVYVEWATAQGFAENSLVGRKLQIGSRVVLAALCPDPCSKIMTLDPDTVAEMPTILRKLARSHGGSAGIYCAVLTEGMARPGDAVTLLD
jgi:hypothetical protein